MKLQEYRERAGLSQSQLATAAGVSLSTLQKYECGAKDINKAAAITLYKIAHVLTIKGGFPVYIHDLLEIHE